MPTPPPATSPVERPNIVVAALSARALAAAARRAGQRPAVIDLFGDADTRRLAALWIRLPSETPAIDSGALLDGLARPELRGLPLVYGTGFEDDPARLARIAEDRPLLGNPAERVAGVKNPFAFAAQLDRLGIPHPEVSDTLAPGDWLLKRIGGSGGGHIGAATTATAPPGWYFQRRVAGEPLSVLFLADGRRAVIVGMSRQWTAPTADAPHRYGGAAGPLHPARDVGEALSAMTARVAEAFGLVGLNSADFLVDGVIIHLLEINPRPGATLDVFDREPMPPLFGLHLEACAGRLPETLPAFRDCRAAVILYADQPMLIGEGFRWPSWAADRPVGPARIAQGEPVCTVSADGADVGSAQRKALRRLNGLAQALARLPPPRPSPASQGRGTGALSACGGSPLPRPAGEG